MKSAIVSLFFLLCISQSSRAAFTDFEDLADQFVRYPVGSIIGSNGLSFEVIPFPSPTGAFISDILDYTSPLETTLIGTGRAGLVFELPPSANHISFDYAVGNSSGMIINGVATPLADAFEQLDGTTVGGVLITIGAPLPTPLFFDGRMTLSGQIDSFTIGGVQLHLDNVAVFVPEPSTVAIMVVAAGAIGRRRSRCR